jgi:hypothetical protein
VTAFGGKPTVRGATPIEASFPQTGAGSDEGDEGLRPRVGHHAWLSAIRRQVFAVVKALAIWVALLLIVLMNSRPT